VRRFLGGPGSWRRWLVFSAAWLIAWACVYAFTRNGVLLFLAVLADLATLAVRPHYIGDEDELYTDLERRVVRTLREGAEPPEDPELRTDPAGWFSRGNLHRFDDAPLPPSADPEQTGEPPSQP
jgi:hypothetical protein